MIKALLVALIVLTIASLFTKCNGVKWYKVSKTPRPVILIIASTHGNEPAGSVALTNYIKSNPQIPKGQLILIPTINACGLLTNTRNNPLGNYDINRNYPAKTYLNQQIQKFIQKADWVIDLHEGWGFHKLNRKSVGSGVYPGNTKAAKHACFQVISHLNQTITDRNKQFTTFRLPNVLGSLRDYCNSLNKHYVLVETSGINDIQPLNIRVEQQSKIIKFLIEHILR